MNFDKKTTLIHIICRKKWAFKALIHLIAQFSLRLVNLAVKYGLRHVHGTCFARQSRRFYQVHNGFWLIFSIFTSFFLTNSIFTFSYKLVLFYFIISGY